VFAIYILYGFISSAHHQFRFSIAREQTREIVEGKIMSKLSLVLTRSPLVISVQPLQELLRIAH